MVNWIGVLDCCLHIINESTITSKKMMRKTKASLPVITLPFVVFLEKLFLMSDMAYFDDQRFYGMVAIALASQ